ncbi:MAG: hypothetical protein ACREOM_09625 [Candidatus Dormibacteraceae bacterium]
MSRKGKKRAKGKYRPPVRPAGPLTPGIGTTAAGVAAVPPQRSVSQARVGGDQALVRSVEMSLGARNQIVKGRGGRFIVESADPSIPLDRVPYFTKDLVRLAVVGGAMVVLLAIGSVTVPLIFK